MKFLPSFLPSLAIMLMILAWGNEIKASVAPLEFSVPSVVDLYSERIASVRLITSSSQKTIPQNVFAFSEDGGVVESELRNDNNIYYFSDLSSFDSYTFFYMSYDSQIVGIGESPRKFSKGDWIDVSLDFHQMLRDWMLTGDPSKNALHTAVINSDFDDVTKASFIQKYFYAGKEFSGISDILDRSNLKEYNYDKSLVTCNCSGVRVPTWYRIEPGFIPDEFTDGLIRPDRFDPFEHVLDQDKLEYYKQSIGPAKLWIAYSDGRREDRNKWYGGSVGALSDTNGNPDSDEDINALSQRIAQVFTQVCTSSIGDLSECSCVRRVDLHFFYESTVSVYAEIGSGSSNKRSAAVGEDIAVAYTIQEETVIDPVNGRVPATEFTYIDGFQNLEMSACNIDINTQFNSALGQSLGAIAGLGATFIIGTGATGSNQQMLINSLRSQFIGQIVAQGASLFTNPPAVPTTPCTQVIQNSPKVIDRPAFYILTPNAPLYAGIASGAQMVSRGMRSWQSDVKIASDFFLTANFPGGLELNRNSDCCTERSYGYYWGKSLDGEVATDGVHVSERFDFLPPSFESEIRELVATSFSSTDFLIEGDFIFNDDGRRTVPFDYGTLIFGPRKGGAEVCKQPYAGGGIFGDIRGEVDGCGDCIACSDCIWSNPDNTSKLYTSLISDESSSIVYELYTIDGRRIGNGGVENLASLGVFRKASKGLLFEPYSLLSRFPSGVYIVAFSGSTLNKPVSLKVIKR